MKITGAEFKEWHDTAWPDGHVWIEDTVLSDGRELYLPDGNSFTVKPDEVFVVPSEWYVMPENCQGEGKTVRSLIKKWQKAKSTSTIAIEVPREREADLRAFCAENNFRVMS